ncbi:hypothetical protein HII31_13275 [Pseudocercospora fuligena]|uniref:Uncharacterized protein n=1 Tax=Pseudocercospora fuligena TaxID=685502 RepID=A0A8H6VAU7_9PEZI|nr:hypothetical protein HII31_13275 [Pseudocercospora fuligena]
MHTTKSPANPNACLLSIPAEMRNRIYRLVLLEYATNPKINDGGFGRVQFLPHGPHPQEPSLLQTCTQIRKEASSIYYMENRFVFEARDCDITLAMDWFSSSKLRRQSDISLALSGNPNWKNLITWLQAAFKNKIGFMASEPSWSRTPSDNAMCWQVPHAMRLVKMLKVEQQMSWAQVEAMLEVVHDLMVSLDPKWA